MNKQSVQVLKEIFIDEVRFYKCRKISNRKKCEKHILKSFWFPLDRISPLLSYCSSDSQWANCLIMHVLHHRAPQRSHQDAQLKRLPVSDFFSPAPKPKVLLPQYHGRQLMSTGPESQRNAGSHSSTCPWDALSSSSVKWLYPNAWKIGWGGLHQTNKTS